MNLPLLNSLYRENVQKLWLITTLKKNINNIDNKNNHYQLVVVK